MAMTFTATTNPIEVVGRYRAVFGTWANTTGSTSGTQTATQLGLTSIGWASGGDSITDLTLSASSISFTSTTLTATTTNTTRSGTYFVFGV